MGKKKVITIEPTLVRDKGSENTNLRVAACCRVSTDSQEQENSYENQLTHYTNLINSHPSWINAGIFADKGISGKFKNKRPSFLKMIAACEAKQIDQIITKSISRFGRNTQETVEIVRKLRDLNIGVFFEKENLFSLDSRTDFILMILSSIAEEESRDLSTNVKWTFAKQASQGIIMSPHAYFGYTAKGKDLVINSKNAKIVRLIYDTFEQRKVYPLWQNTWNSKAYFRHMVILNGIILPSELFLLTRHILEILFFKKLLLMTSFRNEKRVTANEKSGM
ncbi:MAG: hypothetical protein BWX72_02121 [Firmicutes bacterium ADurb.Bin080]|nr:MAG: hypothetical protein BWX72_02121 [Firmicutes bacterium ADurb.Bin080]